MASQQSAHKLEDHKYFVPSLLLTYDANKDLVHPAMQFWARLNSKYVLRTKINNT